MTPTKLACYKKVLFKNLILAQKPSSSETSFTVRQLLQPQSQQEKQYEDSGVWTSLASLINSLIFTFSLIVLFSLIHLFAYFHLFSPVRVGSGQPSPLLRSVSSWSEQFVIIVIIIVIIIDVIKITIIITVVIVSPLLMPVSF